MSVRSSDTYICIYTYEYLQYRYMYINIFKICILIYIYIYIYKICICMLHTFSYTYICTGTTECPYVRVGNKQPPYPPGKKMKTENISETSGMLIFDVHFCIIDLCKYLFMIYIIFIYLFICFFSYLLNYSFILLFIYLFLYKYIVYIVGGYAGKFDAIAAEGPTSGAFFFGGKGTNRDGTGGSAHGGNAPNLIAPSDTATVLFIGCVYIYLWIHVNICPCTHVHICMKMYASMFI
jgi:hypothetical protein